MESRKRQAPYAGAFLLKDEQGTDPNVVSASDTEKNIYELKGKDLFSRLHVVGTLAQVHHPVVPYVFSGALFLPMFLGLFKNIHGCVLGTPNIAYFWSIRHWCVHIFGGSEQHRFLVIEEISDQG